MFSINVVEEKGPKRKFVDLYDEVVKCMKAEFRISDNDIEIATESIKREFHRSPWKSDSFFGVDFNDVAKCCGYLLRYAPCHTALTRHLTKEFLKNASFDVVNALFGRENCKVVSLGGGPGNDLIGFCSALTGEKRRSFRNLDLTIVDLKEGWSQMFSTMCEVIKRGDFGFVSKLFKEVIVKNSFLTANLAEYEGTLQAAIDSISQADFIMTVKFLSHVSPVKKHKILEMIFRVMKPGAVFFVIDGDLTPEVFTSISNHDVHIIQTPKYRKKYIFSRGRRFPASITCSSYNMIAMQKRATV